MAPSIAAAPEAQLDALFLPFASGELPSPDDGRGLFLRARESAHLRAFARADWLCEQGFRPFADELRRAGLAVGEAADGESFAAVLLLPPRQRDEARASFARAAVHVRPGGIVLAAVPNAEGAKSAEADFVRLFGPVRSLSKHKCRVFWAAAGSAIDTALRDEWSALDAPRRIAGGYLSRPGLFAWDRIDTASALLAAHLPADLHGRVADLGAGYGYLATQVVARCPAVMSIDLYEAEARALELARVNLAEAVAASGRAIGADVHWHDVTAGLVHHYDAIVSNPPFHQGRADLPELGRAFIEAAAGALLPHGRLWLVANRHLPYEATLASRFAQVRTVAMQDGFKVIEAVRA
ncbi:class I SAM-dependent methyltransferase [Frateuria terrea]|uniref:16S rRNA (Guanine1207-N2)-methyltransferase n=1 Tax=Frateuria terrea TaxID=529704 RepID=A0A1H6W6Y3_9GAMM|nr:class I SAM-dependent methyltransferase [Frateuria terrea]SEJ10994.1 16S rRNA (guanine1207-N2)-methyltransferase [Frateuria terrea]SFP67581.1 16S rRNA (guanine1207-N2)-methyltransferase [Frateuria terrea]